MKDYQIENKGKITTIKFNGRIMPGIKLPHRTGSGPHKRKDDRVRGNLVRNYFDGKFKE